jgi:DNA polymerase III epsilon subunit-like protein
MDETWVSVDLETNGAVPGLYDLVSIGACVIGDTDKVFYAEVRPQGLGVDPEATAIHRLRADYLAAHGMDVVSVVALFVGWARQVSGASRPVFCSWGTFDWMWVGWHLERHGRRYTHPFGPNSLDLKSYYLGLTKGPQWRTAQKRWMPEDDLRGGHTHNALEDAVEQAQMVEGWWAKYGGGPAS